MTRAAAAALAALALWAAPAAAQPYDPDLRFRTLETPHFLVHFHDGEEALAQLAARYCEKAHELLVPMVGHEPRERTHVLLVDVDDSANGWAIPIPRNTMELRAAPPDARGELNQFEDWLWQLVVHEYTHVLHLDTIAFPSTALNAVFGKMFWPNGAWPRWFTEGWAVHTESALSQGGRVRSALHDMQLRMHVLEGEALDLDTLSHSPLDWPRGGAWYLYGGRFLDLIAKEHGEEALRAMSRGNAASIVPFQLQRFSRDATGKPFDELFREFLDAMRVKYEAQREAIGTPTPETVLTKTGDVRRTPRPSIDGRTIYSLVADANALPRLVALDVASGREHVVAELVGDGTLAVADDSHVLVSQPEITNNFLTFDDLFLVDAKSGRRERVTHGLRASEPDVSRDGRVVFVRRPGPARTAISISDLSQLKKGGYRDLYVAPTHSPVGSPRLSPDGRQVVFLEHRGGSFDLRLVDVETREVLDLTKDAAQDLSPSFSEDGRRILFSSDRTGIFDVYELDLATREVRRRTRVVGGAFEPVELGGTLHYLRYGAHGLDLARAGSEAREPAPPAPPPLAPTLEKVATGETYPEKPYAAWRTLGPTYWMPILSSDARGVALGATTGGRDVLGRWSWGAAGWYGLYSKEPGFFGALRTDAFPWSHELQVSRSIVNAPGTPPGYVESDLGARLATSHVMSRADHAFRVEFAYELDSLSPVDAGDLSPTGRLPRRGLLSALRASASWTNARRFARAISSEQGQRLSFDFRGASRLLGGDFEGAHATVSWAGFQRLPWLRHHVLAARVQHGLGSGHFGGRQLFGLGGPLTLGFLSDIPALQSPTRLLRGFPSYAFAGSAFALATAEYRFPIAEVEAGWSTLPVYLRRVHGAAFVDVGDAWRASERIVPRVGVGAELRAEVVFGYSLATDLRLGYARGLSFGGGDQLLLLLGTHF